MQVWETDLRSPLHLHNQLTICLGFFDGLHLGHQALIQTGIALKNPVAVLTFDRNPKPGRVAQNLTPLSRKKTMLETMGVSYLIVVKFLEEVKTLPAKAFLDFLFSIGGKDLVCGPDFRFGKDAIGDVQTIQNDGRFTLHLVPPHMYENQKISTSAIVSMLAAGQLETMQQLLGRPYVVEGFVGKGLGEGRKMGYPTANIVLDAPYYLPKNGVYITLIKIDGQTYYSLASLGFHPTVANLSSPTLEVFVLNYQANLYEKHVEVAFLHYLRPEQKFPSKDALIQQMDLDKATAIRLKPTFPKEF